VLAVANGRAVPEAVTAAFAGLPAVMAKAASHGGQIDRAVIDLAETVMLSGRDGEVFHAVVTDIDDRGAHIQLCDLPIVTRVNASHVTPGQELSVKVRQADPQRPPATFDRIA